MKTLEEKALAYDEMSRFLKDWYNNKTDICIKDYLEVTFPELVAVKDENIRKSLISYFNENKQALEVYNHMNINEIIAWLEKQKTCRPTLRSANDVSNLNEVLKYITDSSLREWLILTINSYCNSHAWTSEDEEIRKSIIKKLEDIKSNSVVEQHIYYIEKEIEWLEKLN